MKHANRNLQFINDCELCKRIPNKVEVDFKHDGIMPPTVEKLTKTLSYYDSPETYSSSEWGILSCPKCGTNYYYSHFIDEGHSFMDPTCDEYKAERWSPDLIIDFLSVQEDEKAKRYLDEFKIRYPMIIEKCKNVLLNNSHSNWQVQRYCSEAVLDYFLASKNWEGLDWLTKHEDPVVRLEICYDLLYMSSEKYAVWSHRNFNKVQVSNAMNYILQENKIEELIAVIVNILKIAPKETFQFCTIMDEYEITNTHKIALAALSYANYYKIEVSSAIPILRSFLSEEQLNKLKTKTVKELIDVCREVII